MRPKGFKMSEESKQKISETHKRNGFKPKTCSLRGKESCSYGRKWSDEQRKKQGERNKRLGLVPPSRKGKHHTKEAKIRISISHQKEKSYLWRGGSSYKPYSLDWTETLRRSIRERDYYSCKHCGKQQGDKIFDVHHIDFNKKNCNPNNLITLCKSCHSKTTHKRNKETVWSSKL